MCSLVEYQNTFLLEDSPVKQDYGFKNSLIPVIIWEVYFVFEISFVTAMIIRYSIIPAQLI